MTSDQKERFCLLTAALLAPPDDLLEADLEQPGLRVELEGNLAKWGGSMELLSPLFANPGTRPTLGALKGEYDRLFLDPEGEVVSLVESTYKAWTKDSGAGATLGGSKGLLMGDSALHMREMYRQLSIEVPEELRTTPDHLVAELEFLALLFRSALEEHAGQFAEHHLDWVAELETEIERAQAYPFYRSVLKIVGLFIVNEVQNGRACCYG